MNLSIKARRQPNWLALRVWEDDGGLHPQDAVHEALDRVSLSYVDCFREPVVETLPVQPGGEFSLSSQRDRVPCGWQRGSFRGQDAYRKAQKRVEVFLDFDPVCPEWQPEDYLEHSSAKRRDGLNRGRIA